MVIKFYLFKQNVLSGVKDGVCLEISQRWIYNKLTNNWKEGETIYDFADGDELSSIISRQRERGTTKDIDIGQLGHVLSNCRRCLGFGLRSRVDVINHVVSIPGFYVFVVTGLTSSGHAFAFDTTNINSIYFFDANQGEWRFTDESHENMRLWWSKFWDGNGGEKNGYINYKKLYNKGTRELHKYHAPPRIIFCGPRPHRVIARSQPPKP